MSAPNSSGRWKYGVANVLSTINSALGARGDLLHGREVGDPEHGIRRRLDQNRTCLRRDRIGDALGVARVDVCETKPEIDQNPIEQARRAAIHILAAHDVIAGAEQLHDRVEASHAARERESVLRALEGGDVSLQRFPRRILAACVLVPFVFADAVLYVCGRQVESGS